tara:strand:- start:361 stop:747 length:387 start_codon:yes stop_codon:yes gene_type:complete
MRVTSNGRELDLEFTLAAFESYFTHKASRKGRRMYHFFLQEVDPELACIDGNFYGAPATFEYVEGKWNGHESDKIRVRLGFEGNKPNLQLICIDGEGVELFPYDRSVKIEEPLAEIKAEFLNQVERYF